MIQRLKNKYSHALIDNNSKVAQTFHLKISDATEEVLFDTRKLSKDEKELLETIFPQEENLLPPMTSAEEFLQLWLIKNNDVEPLKIEKLLPTPFRFIHFHIKGAILEQVDFTEAMKSLFQSANELLWIAPDKGILVQLIDDHFDEDMDEESIIDTIASDFFVQLSLYIGSPITDLETAKERFHWEANVFEKVRRHVPAKALFVEQDIIPYLAIKDMSEETKKATLSMLAPVLEDRTLLESVKVYLECNLNTSLAAKKLYMHRNTLQYRVDKFIEKTSIDIKQFPNAVAVYFMFIVLESSRREE